MNWDSRTNTWNPVVKQETKEKELYAKVLRKKGYTVSEIAERMGLSEGRIREYLRS